MAITYDAQGRAIDPATGKPVVAPAAAPETGLNDAWFAQTVTPQDIAKEQPQAAPEQAPQVSPNAWNDLLAAQKPQQSTAADVPTHSGDLSAWTDAPSDTPKAEPAKNFSGNLDAWTGTMSTPQGTETTTTPVAEAAPAADKTVEEKVSDRNKDFLSDKLTRRKAALAFGVGLLSGNNFFDGVAKGASGYQAAIDEAVKKNTPTYSNTADGRFTIKTGPDGQEVNENAVVGDVVRKKEQEERESAEAQTAAKLQEKREENLRNLEVKREQIQANLEVARQRGEDTRAMQAQLMDIRRESTQLRRDALDFQKSTYLTPQQKRQQDLDARAQDAGYKAAESARSQIPQYEAMKKQLGGAGVGAGVLQSALRNVVSIVGMDLAGVNINDMQALQQSLAGGQLDAALAKMQGQGAISDNERRLLASTIPSMATNPAVARRVIDTLQTAAQRNVRLMEDYEGAVNDGYTGTFRSYQLATGEDFQKSNDRVYGNASTPARGGADTSPVRGPKPNVSPQVTTSIIQQALPKAVITSVLRSKKEQADLVRRGATKATDSWHNHGPGIDIKPIPGMTFLAAKARIAQYGRIVEAIDESRRGGTGPHWHFAVLPFDQKAPTKTQYANVGAAGSKYL